MLARCYCATYGYTYSCKYGDYFGFIFQTYIILIYNLFAKIQGHQCLISQMSGFKGLRQGTVHLYINITIDDKQNYPYCKLGLLIERIDTYSLKPTNQTVPKVWYDNGYKTLGTSIINSPMSSQSLEICEI